MLDRLIAGGVALILAALHARLAAAWHGATREPATGDRRLFRLYLACTTLFLLAAPLAGPHGDYGAYQRFWARVRDGADPWLGAPVNAYGPLFNAFAVLTPLSWLTPKVLFAFGYVLFVSWMTLGSTRERAVAWPLAIGLVMNPVVWIEQVFWGNFDVLAGAACVLAIDRCRQGRQGGAGAWLAAGAGLKMLPALVLPALLVDRGRLRIRLVVSTSVITAAVFAASAAVWGLEATLRPFAFAATRLSQNSIFSFLRGPLSPLRLVWAAANVDWLSTPLLVLAVAAAALRVAQVRADGARAGLAGVLAALLFYRTGLVRYQMMLAPVLAYWWMVEGARGADRRAVVRWLALWGGWLTFSDITGWLAAVTWNGISEPGVVRAMELVSGRSWGPVMLALEFALLWLLLRRPAPAVAASAPLATR